MARPITSQLTACVPTPIASSKQDQPGQSLYPRLRTDLHRRPSSHPPKLPWVAQAQIGSHNLGG